jgi:predicted ATPase/DNA-binding winged helix-turn-helix (wHTH) protein
LNSTVEYRFGRVAVITGQRRVIVDGEPAKLGGRAFDVLTTLIENRRRVVGKAELLDRVWTGVIVGEGNLQVQINTLRKFLGANVILTIPGRGYRFVAEVDGAEGASGESLETSHASSPPTDATAFGLLGRDAEVQAVQTLVDEHRLVTIVCAGGIGKTRLAQAVAQARRQAFRDGVCVIEFAGVADPSLVVPTIARALGHALGARNLAADALAESMRGQQALVVLDNCEHLIDEMARLALAIGATASTVRLLVTSQELLRVPQEHLFRLGPLATPEFADLSTAAQYGAVALFVARGRASDPRFRLTEGNVAAVVEICRRLDGVPLALEMAAARTPMLGVEGVRRRLDEQLRLLTDGSRHALPRHRALRAALQWSYLLLAESERAFLDALGAFTGGFSLEAATGVIGGQDDPWAALDMLSSLIDKSLVIVGDGEPPRYRLLETTRAFALERLAEYGSLGAVRRRHAAAIVASFRSDDALESVSRRLARTSPDLDNLRAAVAWATGPDGDRHIAIELAGEADNLWFDSGAGEEGEALFAGVKPWVDETTPPCAAARFWLSRASLLLMKSLREGATAGFKAAELYRDLGDRVSRFRALILAASQLGMAGDFDPALAAIGEAQSLIESSWPA